MSDTQMTPDDDETVRLRHVADWHRSHVRMLQTTIAHAGKIIRALRTGSTVPTWQEAGPYAASGVWGDPLEDARRDINRSMEALDGLRAQVEGAQFAAPADRSTATDKANQVADVLEAWADELGDQPGDSAEIRERAAALRERRPGRAAKYAIEHGYLVMLVDDCTCDTPDPALYGHRSGCGDVPVMTIDELHALLGRVLTPPSRIPVTLDDVAGIYGPDWTGGVDSVDWIRAQRDDEATPTDAPPEPTLRGWCGLDDAHEPHDTCGGVYVAPPVSTRLQEAAEKASSGDAALATAAVLNALANHIAEFEVLEDEFGVGPEFDDGMRTAYFQLINAFRAWADELEGGVGAEGDSDERLAEYAQNLSLNARLILTGADIRMDAVTVTALRQGGLLDDVNELTEKGRRVAALLPASSGVSGGDTDG